MLKGHREPASEALYEVMANADPDVLKRILQLTNLERRQDEIIGITRGWVMQALQGKNKSKVLHQVDVTKLANVIFSAEWSGVKLLQTKLRSGKANDRKEVLMQDIAELRLKRGESIAKFLGDIVN